MIYIPFLVMTLYYLSWSAIGRYLGFVMIITYYLHLEILHTREIATCHNTSRCHLHGPIPGSLVGLPSYFVFDML